MKTITTTLLLILTLASTAQTKQAKEVITRFAKGAKVELYMIDKQNGCDVFETSSDGNKITIKGSSGTALCRGFYDFVKNNGYGINSSSGNRCMVPNKLPNIGLRRVVAPVEHHFYLNVVTYGYSTPYWDWERWSQEIDYMALHGIDMPLALVANEAISARVWKKLGLTDEQIANYFVGPAHFPWMRMGNISGIDGPLPDSWHKGQVELQHKILSKMRGLGMKPICPAFAGFVPKEMAQLFPEAKIVETSWSGGSFKNWMVMPENELFSRIGTMFIKEWEKEFGTNTYYLADSFNEMEIPFPPIGSPERYTMLNNYGQILYNSIREANKDAVWVMQGWMFGYQRHIWEPRSLEALCAKVPDDKMLLLDEAVDYNKHFWHNGPNWDFHYGFYGKPWIYGSIPNMGGKNGMTGILDFYANGHLEALLSANRGRLVGIGMAPEGIENNEVIYELITDAAWSSDSIDVPHWLHNYSLNRYGACPQAIDSAWKYLLKSVYGTFTDHPRYNWQVRPGNMRQGSINSSTNFFKAIEFFASAANEKSLSYLYNVDLIEFTAAYIGGKMELKTMAIENDFLLGNLEEAAKSEAEFIDLSLQIDRLLESHPTQRMERWIDFARANGISHTEKDYYEKNARRIVTVWGPPVDDYSARIWSGLIRDYYLPRWKKYFQSRHSGQPFDTKALSKWELNWVEQQHGLSPCTPYSDVRQAATKMIAQAQTITAPTTMEVIGSWSGGESELRLTLSLDKVRKMKGVRFIFVGGAGEMNPKEVTLEMDGVVTSSSQVSQSRTVSEKNRVVECPIELPEKATGNNSCILVVKMQGEQNRGNIVLF